MYDTPVYTYLLIKILHSKPINLFIGIRKTENSLIVWGGVKALMLTVVKSRYTQQKYRIYLWSKVNAYTSLPP